MQITEIIKDLIYMIGSISTVVTFFSAQYRINKGRKRQQQHTQSSSSGEQSISSSPANVPVENGHPPKFMTIFRAYKASIIIFVISVLLVLMLDIVVPIVITASTESTSETPTPPATPSAPISTQTVDAWLDELDPIIAKSSAFFLTNWNSFEPVQVESTPYIHSIGIRIPYETFVELIQNAPVEEQIHSEYIEYRLSNNYESFQFDYGIDDSSYSDEYESASMCEFKILVQSCDSQNYLGPDDNILFDSGWYNYRCTVHHSPLINVSGCEAIRITAIWKFYVRQNGPVAFNIAIVNPILRAAKADAMVSQTPN